MVNLRSTGGDGFLIVETTSGELLGTVDAARAHNTTHDGAVYLHGGRAYEVSELDLQHRRALVRPFDGDWYTQAKRETDMYIERLDDRREWLGVRLSFGTVVVTEQVLAYQRKRLSDHEAIDLVALDLPQTSFATQALWYELPDTILGPAVPIDELLGSLHAAEHSQIAVLPLLAMCDRWDIGGLSTACHADTDAPTVFVYDGHPGGAGFAEQAFRKWRDWLGATRAAIADCGCTTGCPACIQSPKCGNGNEPLDKPGSVAILDLLLKAGEGEGEHWKAPEPVAPEPPGAAPAAGGPASGSAGGSAAGDPEPTWESDAEFPVDF
jgi:DEAD/DEAH box helicase domain-containing protein